MRSADYPYPPDEFDAAASSGGPRGAHRTPQSRWSRWWPFLVVVVVFPALAFGVVTWISSGGGLPFGSHVAADPSTSSSAPPESSTAPSDSATEPASSPPPETETPTPEPNFATAVQVENATKTSGLAGRARDTLEAGGFTDVSVGNWAGAAVDATVVFYAAPADQGTANKVAELLGIGQVVEDATRAEAGVVVVLEADFTP